MTDHIDSNPHDQELTITPDLQEMMDIAENARIRLDPRALVMREVNKSIPVNEDYAQLEYFYRADLIPNDLFELNGFEKDAYLENAIIDLDYSQGFPCLPNAHPFWSQLPCESPEAYRCFQAFLDIPHSDDPNDLGQ